ncbi:MAG TPA: nitrile hydratase subunit beta [Chloroflexota bacterium]|nr:nitrile hydratase subunit beta [Chloroflexota bacterium]
MNGVHDMGGMQDMGPVVREENEPVFHADWEGRVYGLTRVLNLGPKWTVDQSRFSMEQMPPARYLQSSYYERWLFGLESRLLAAGVVSEKELADGKPRPGGVRVPKVTREQYLGQLQPWRAPKPEADPPAKFKVGDRVRARNIHPKGHTRLPRYIRGHVGTVERNLGVQRFPDSWVASQDPRYQHTYSVRFSPEELWGPDANSKDAIYVDLWDEYLDPA